MVSAANPTPHGGKHPRPSRTEEIRPSPLRCTVSDLQDGAYGRLGKALAQALGST